MKQPVLGFAMCGSFCTYQPVLEALEELHTVFPDIIPIMSGASFAIVFPVQGAMTSASSSAFGPIGSTSGIVCRIS